jgi:hypothetical protein
LGGKQVYKETRITQESERWGEKRRKKEIRKKSLEEEERTMLGITYV